MSIEKKLVKSPDIIVYNIISLMQQWTTLLSGKEQELVMVAKVIKMKVLSGRLR
jgi:phage-related baseplate assembly protein